MLPRRASTRRRLHHGPRLLVAEGGRSMGLTATPRCSLSRPQWAHPVAIRGLKTRLQKPGRPAGCLASANTPRPGSKRQPPGLPPTRVAERGRVQELGLLQRSPWDSAASRRRPTPGYGDHVDSDPECDITCRPTADHASPPAKGLISSPGTHIVNGSIGPGRRARTGRAERRDRDRSPQFDGCPPWRSDRPPLTWTQDSCSLRGTVESNPAMHQG